jgi:hypothetical protein
MRKMLLATVAVVPLLAVGMMPAASQDIKQQSGKEGMSQSPGAARPQMQEKRGEAAGKEAQGKPEPSTKANQASDNLGKAQDRTQQKTEGRAFVQDQGKDRAKSESNKSESNKQAGEAKPSQDSKQGQARTEDRNGGQPGKAKAAQGANSGAKSQVSQDKANQEKANQSSGAKSQASQDKANGKQPNGAQNEPAKTTGQTTRPNQETGRQQQNNDPGQQNNQRTQQNNAPQNNNAQQNNAQQNNARPNVQGENRTDAAGRVTLNEEQRTKIQQTVLSSRDAPRVDRVNFRIDVGVEVPREIRVVEVPQTLVEIYPEWRGHQYFVVQDEIVIVDRSRRILARAPVGSSSASVERRTSSSTTTVDWSEVDVRRVQEVLVERGFYNGPVDGVFRPEIQQALIKFQEREGFEASGRIDERTSVALGVSIRTQGQGTQGQADPKTGQSTSGQAGGSPGSAAPGTPQNNNAGNPGQTNRPSTAGQGSNTPSAGDNKATGQGNRPATSGQGGNQPSGNVSPTPNANDNKTSGQQGGTQGQSMPQNQPSTSGTTSGTSEDQRKR